MENTRSEEEKIIKDIRNLFRLRKEIKGITDRILRDIRNRFEYEKEEENYYKPVKVNNFRINNYSEYKSHDDKKKILSVEEYINEIRPYLKGIRKSLKKSDRWKIQLTITINFISSEFDNDEDRVMHSKSDNIEIMTSDEADEFIKKHFDSLKNRYQNNLESMRGSEFAFDFIINVIK